MRAKQAPGKSAVHQVRCLTCEYDLAGNLFEAGCPLAMLVAVHSDGLKQQLASLPMASFG
jgi:hypothetical protein